MKMFRNGLALSLCAGVLAASGGCAVYHHYGAVEGKVVEVGTGTPLDGAAVLAVYYTDAYGPAGSVSQFLDAQEAVTDEKGEFRIPSLNTFTFRPLQSFQSYIMATIFKPGYGCYPRHKGVKPMFMPYASLPQGRYVVIEMPKLDSINDRMININCFPASVPNEKMRKLIDIINIESIALGLQPTRNRGASK